MLPGKTPKLPGYDVVMLIYLITGAAILPLIIGELLVEAGLMQAMSEKTMPSWMYGYVVMVTFAGGFGLFVGWIPAIYVCIRYRRQWRAVLPALAILVCTISVFAMGESEAVGYVAAVAASAYAILAFAVGLEWLVRQLR